MTIPNTIPITPDLIANHGLKPDEYQRILDLIGREPTFTELGIFSAMWNEHCSYKSSKKWLRTLPTKGPRVIQGPGENAGVVDIDDGDCVVFSVHGATLFPPPSTRKDRSRGKSRACARPIGSPPPREASRLRHATVLPS